MVYETKSRPPTTGDDEKIRANINAGAPGEPLRDAPAPADPAGDAGTPGMSLGDAPDPVDPAGDAVTLGVLRGGVQAPGQPQPQPLQNLQETLGLHVS